MFLKKNHFWFLFLFIILAFLLFHYILGNAFYVREGVRGRSSADKKLKKAKSLVMQAKKRYAKGIQKQKRGEDPLYEFEHAMDDYNEASSIYEEKGMSKESNIYYEKGQAVAVHIGQVENDRSG
jgi:hypothetical protein